MTFTESISTCFSKYATFEGVASRSEYWWFYLFNLLAGIAMALIGDPAFALFWLATLLPSLAVAVRRLHDTDRSGWFLLLSFVPIVGLVVLYFLCQNTKPNRFSAPVSAPAPDQAESTTKQEPTKAGQE